MLKKISAILIIFIFCFEAGDVYADRPGFEFLRTHVGARPAALGGAFLTFSGDIHSVYYNPAALTTLNSRQLTFSYLNHFLDFQSGFFAYSFTLPNYGRIALASHFIGYGEFNRTDELGNENGTFGAGSLLLMVDYAQEIAPNFSVGIAMKYIRSTIAEFSSSALAGDFGVLFRIPGEQLSFAAGIFNLGSVTSAFVETKDDLPVSIRVGVNKSLEHLPLQLTLEGYRYNDEDPEFVIGGELTLTPFLFLRLSYNSIGQDQKINDTGNRFSGMSIGTGISLDKSKAFSGMFWQKLNIDYSLSSAGDIGAQNRISLSISF